MCSSKTTEAIRTASIHLLISEFKVSLQVILGFRTSIACSTSSKYFINTLFLQQSAGLITLYCAIKSDDCVHPVESRRTPRVLFVLANYSLGLFIPIFIVVMTFSVRCRVSESSRGSTIMCPRSVFRTRCNRSQRSSGLLWSFIKVLL